MLNPFPDLFTFSFFAPFLLRVVVGAIFIDLGALVFRKERSRWLVSLSTLGIPKPEISLKVLGVIEIVGGLMLIAGAYTQIVALILAIFTLIETYIEYKDPDILKRSLVFYLLIFVILFSLLLSGAGAYAVDLPL